MENEVVNENEILISDILAFINLGDKLNISKALEKNPDIINVQNDQGLTCLHFAISKGDLDIVKAILNVQQCNPNIEDDFGVRPIHVACKAVRPIILDGIEASEDRADVAHDVMDRVKSGILVNKVEESHFQVENIDKGEEGSTSNDVHNDTTEDDLALNHVFKNESDISEDIEVSKIDQSKDPIAEIPENSSVKNQSLYIPSIPSEEIALFVVNDQRVVLDCVDNVGLTPLLISIMVGSYNLVSVLLSRNVNVDLNTFTTPLCLACKLNFSNIAKLLLDQGADPNIQDLEMNSPLHYACINNNKDLIKMLVNKKSNPDLTNLDKLKPSQLIEDNYLKGFIHGKKISEMFPLQIDYITVGDIGSAKIGLSMCPGRRKNVHYRDLEMDINVMKQNKVEVVITLVRMEELKTMGMPDYIERLKEHGFLVHHAPIRDKWIPKSMDFLHETVDVLLEHIKSGRNIVVHCNGGKGRAGLVVASTLITLGIQASQSIDAVRSVRKGALYNPIQLVYLRAFMLDVKKRKKLEEAEELIGANAIEECISDTGDDDSKSDNFNNPKEVESKEYSDESTEEIDKQHGSLNKPLNDVDPEDIVNQEVTMSNAYDQST